MPETQVVKYSWQFGPYEKAERDCRHGDYFGDFYAVFECNGERDKILCRECGRIRETSCNFDEEFK